MIFNVLELESIVQVGDKTRLDARKTFVSPDESVITLVEIEPEAGSGFIDVTENYYLDWQYSTDGDKAIQLRVTTDGSPELLTKTLTIITEADDKLFSKDSELLPYEPNILQWVREGRNSFIDVHRESQSRILQYLDERGIWDDDGNRLTKDAIINIEEVKDWSKFSTLRRIFEGLSNSNDDVFAEKARKYSDLEMNSRERCAIRLDKDGDGEEDSQKTYLQPIRLYRR